MHVNHPSLLPQESTGNAFEAMAFSRLLLDVSDVFEDGRAFNGLYRSFYHHYRSYAETCTATEDPILPLHLLYRHRQSLVENLRCFLPMRAGPL